jgi:hypothetical protein
MGGGVGDTLLRSVAAVSTGGFSELAREKPFQPGRDRMDRGNVLTAIPPGLGLVKAVSPAPPGLDTSAIDVANKAKAAAAAVQTADAESRRARAAKRQSSVLGSYQPGQSVNASTLQPAQPRRSVLG